MKRAVTVRTTHDYPEIIAQAIRPDNTTEMETTVDGSVVQTRIERETTSGLHSNVDDYVVNVDVATAVLRRLSGTPVESAVRSPISGNDVTPLDTTDNAGAETTDADVEPRTEPKTDADAGAGTEPTDDAETEPNEPTTNMTSNELNTDTTNQDTQ